MIKILSSIFCGALAISVAVAQEGTQKTDGHSIVSDTTTFATNRCFSKAGLGIVNTDLYIVVGSTINGNRNELIVKPTDATEKTWSGRSVEKAQIVIYYEGKVWPKESLPDQFDLSKAVIISFESNKVRFFDFQAMSGGYYERSMSNQ